MMTLQLDPFYLLCDNFEAAQKFVPLGVKTLQLRMKDKPPQEIQQNVRLTKQLCQAYSCQFVVNDYWQIALEEGCDFVHLGQEDAQQADFSLLKKTAIKIGISTHSEEELQNALAFEPDYVALGPIFPTILKKMPWPPQGLERLAKWRTLISKHSHRPIPLVAIGGFTIERGLMALNQGADSVAVVTDVSLNQNPVERVKNWLEVTMPWRNPNN